MHFSFIKELFLDFDVNIQIENNVETINIKNIHLLNFLKTKRTDLVQRLKYLCSITSLMMEKYKSEKYMSNDPFNIRCFYFILNLN